MMTGPFTDNSTLLKRSPWGSNIVVLNEIKVADVSYAGRGG